MKHFHLWRNGIKRPAFVLVGFLFLIGCGVSKHKAASDSIVLFAGAGMTDVLSEMVDSFEVRNNVEFVTNWGSSGTLVRQMENGAKPDIFISASEKWADYADSIGMVVSSLKRLVARNAMVLIVPLKSDVQGVVVTDSVVDLPHLLGKGWLSMGDPGHVPAGQYAQQLLDYYGWSQLLKNQILPAKDVRSALMVVELGEARAGIVYKTDALKSEKVKIVTEFPEASHTPVHFVATVCIDKPENRRFFNFLFSDEAAIIWKKYGFK
ncbi:molybdate ABC transporter substrate-binding protein [Geofilum sp. OHC36d9]|uniref:molybdate ABC transporter substrate-binding protein n=1 Tax=Geofilum sp. OHC36d9 TaxID=3458413 RepID=UPI0040345F8D